VLSTLPGAMELARRGKLVGLLCWPGVLLYVLYVYTDRRDCRRDHWPVPVEGLDLAPLVADLRARAAVAYGGVLLVRRRALG
jgi:hypothetical protein